MWKTLQRVILLSALTLAVVDAGLFGDDKNKGKKKIKSKTDQVRSQADSLINKAVGGTKDTAEKLMKQNPYSNEGGSNYRPQKHNSGAAYVPDPTMDVSESDYDKIIHDRKMKETENYYTDALISDEEHNAQWAEYMQDFVAEEMINFVVPDRGFTQFFEDISHGAGVIIKGAFFVHGGNDQVRIGVVITDPNNEVVYSRRGDIQGIVLFKTTVPGQYTFALVNLDGNGERVVTFAIHTQEEIEEAIAFDFDDQGQRVVRDPLAVDIPTVETPEDIAAASDNEIASLRTALRAIQTASKQVLSSSKGSLQRQHGHNHDMLENARNHWWAMIVELICFVGITAYQLNHIKKSLDNKLIL